MEISDAEWLVNAYEKQQHNVSEETYNRALKLLQVHPYISFECSECEVETAARKGTYQEIKRYCYRCTLYYKKIMRCLMKITEEYFDANETQPWFIYWLKLEGLKVGDEITAYDYMAWNNQMWQEFKKQNGYSENEPTCYINDAITRFNEFLVKKLNAI